MEKVTVPQLQEQARTLKIKGFSKMNKPELIAAIELATERAEQSAIDAEFDNVIDAQPVGSVTREVSMPTEVPPLNLAVLALLAGSMGKSASPMDNAKRGNAYFAQNGTDNKPFTPAQSRRRRKKGNKLKGFKGCTLAEFRQMRRALKKGTPVKVS